MAEYDKLKSEVATLLRAELKELWAIEDTEFLQGLAEDIAKQKWRAITAQDPNERETAEGNLRLMAADLQGHAIIKRLQVTAKGKDVLVRVVQTVIRTIAIPALVAL